MSFVDCVAAAIPRLITFSASWKRIGFAAAALIALLQPAFAAETPRASLAGHVLPALGESTRTARKSASDGDEALTLTVVLKRDDEAGFQQFLAGVHDPASPTFRRFSDPATLAERFGPSATAYTTVRAYFTSQGFAVAEDSQNRLTLTLRGTVRQAETALAVDIVDFSLGERTFHANENEPSLPADIAAHVQAIAGLSNLATPQPSSFALPIIDAICALQAALPIATAPGYTPPTPQQLFDECVTALRNFNKYWNPGGGGALRTPLHADGGGSGQTIGLVEFDSYLTTDVVDFLEIAGFPAGLIGRVSNVHVNGGAQRGANENEVLLDIDTVLAVAPGADIVVFDAPFAGSTSFQTMFNAMINRGVSIISNSWAYCEDQTSLADVESIDSILQTAAASGISVFNGSGDSGATCLDGSANTIGVPADSPHATAVGGTSANTAAGDIYAGETWWNGASASPPGGQGGYGVSRFFARPAYQNGFTSSSFRSVPDVAINADPATASLMICQASRGGCPSGLLYGGTSFAAPLWAALHARLVEVLGEDLGDANQALYPLANTPAFHNAASMGSDFAHVGLGSGDFGRMYLALAGLTAGAVDAGTSSVTVYMTPALVSSPGFSGIPADSASNASVVVTLRDAGGHLVGGKTVTLTPTAGSSVSISPPSAVTSALNGSAVFTITDSIPEQFSLTAKDTTDNVTIAETADVKFAVPSAAGASITAFPTTVAADGVSTTTITVTLHDALNHPTPGKVVSLSQAEGRSVILGPDPPVTDANGQIAFTATDRFEETVTYVATDVTDGNLAVPGSAIVTYSGSAAGSCATAPTAADGYAFTSFINGFASQFFFFGNVNFGCAGASAVAFDANGNGFVAYFPTGALYKFGPDGGAATAPLSTLGPTLSQPVFGRDGRLYATHSATTGDFTTGDLVEIDPETGAQLRVLASSLTCPQGLATDPLSGDLFFDDACTGAGSDNPSIFRVSNPASATPTVSVYATMPATPNGALSIAPDGTIYVVVGYYLNPFAPVYTISGTDQPMPPLVAPLADVTANYWVKVGAANPDGSAATLVILDNLSLETVDLANTTQRTPLATNIGAGTIGPDGCMYPSSGDAIYRLAPIDGVCDFATTNPSPALALTPSSVSPNPAQGGVVTLTATFRNIAAPSGTPVYFEVRGANAQTHFARTDGNGTTSFSYQGLRDGDDVIVATATVGGATLTSNVARVTWSAGPHTSLVDITGPSAATAGQPVALSAVLVDVSVDPPAPIAGGSLHFAVQGANVSCDAAAGANGVATCSLTVANPGAYQLNVSYAGDGQHLPATSSRLLTVPTDGIDRIFADDFDGDD
ncbi:MAG TPA: protease pro-enzyme activation domain-containing protein [Rhodanobacteraceae bacterium]|nr:protease pro-enzyme activation domain-containing protein [Rhodanobacteraceae bacterium]